MSEADEIQPRDYTPGDYAVGDYVTYRHKYTTTDYVQDDYVDSDYVTSAGLVEVPDEEAVTAPQIGIGGIKRRKRVESRLVLKQRERLQTERIEKQQKPEIRKTVSLRKTFVGLYAIEPLPESFRLIEEQNREIDKLIQRLRERPISPTIISLEPKPRKVLQKSFTGLYNIRSLVKKAFTGQYQRKQLVTKQFIGSYDIKAVDWQYLNRLKAAKSYLQQLALLDYVDIEAEEQ